MKTCIALLLFAVAASGQNMKPILSLAPITFGKTNVFNASVYTIGYQSDKPANQTTFVSYNNITGWNDVYVDGSNVSIRSVVCLDNLYRGVKIDSYNPNGASNLEESLASGLLNLIFNGNTGKSRYFR